VTSGRAHYDDPVRTVDRKGRHVWARTPADVHPAYTMSNAGPDAAETAWMETAIAVGLVYLIFLLVYRVRKLVRFGPR
jgi:hypothetical protein